jgi:glycosyltransferase involved in cell wall biosynthesis
MKILIITPFFPYSNVYHAGGKFTCEIIKALSQRHEIHLLSRIEPAQFVFVNEMKKFCTHIELFPFKTPKAANIVSILRIIASYLSLGLKANRLIKSGNFDLVQIEHVETGLLIKKIRNFSMILDAHDVITKPVMRRYMASRGILEKMVNYFRCKITKKIETYITRKFDMVFTRSEQDKEVLSKLNSGLPITVVPHPVINMVSDVRCKREPKALLFAGAMHRDVNIESVLYFYEKIWPHIRREIPDARFYIVGNKPNQRVKALAKKDKDVVVTGFVEKLEPYYLRASVFVSPLFIGGGIIAKNLQAMALGLPVVTTSVGNEGIEAVPEKDILIADDPDAFAKKVLLLLRNTQKWDEIACNGKKFVLKNFGLGSVVKKIEDSYRVLLSCQKNR